MTERERLIELIQAADKLAFNECKDKVMLDIRKMYAKYIADYLLANGVIVPPCKVGDVVYYIAFGKIYKSKCHTITQHKNSLQIHLYDYDGDNARFAGNRVFLTREEAEKALEQEDEKE